MRQREYIIPVALLAGIATFFVVQLREARKSRPKPVAEIASTVAPQGRAAESKPSSTPARADTLQQPDSTALEAPAGDVTVQPSTARAPAIDTSYVRELLREGSPGTYMPELLAQQDQALMRWPDRRTAMRVWIERDARVPNWDPQYAIATEQAFAEWQEAGFPLRFDMVLEPGDVDIRIKWIEKFAPEDGQRIGLTRKIRDQHGWLVAVEISIATHDSSGKPLQPATMTGTARHEIGHALGLGHSGSEGDVMFPESRTTLISAADRKTLRLLYMLPPGRMP